MNNQTSASLGIGVNKEQSKREKYWNELTADEKIERMRSQVKWHQAELNNLKNEVNDLRMKVINHSHAEGKVVIPVNHVGATLGGITGYNKLIGNPEEVFF